LRAATNVHIAPAKVFVAIATGNEKPSISQNGVEIMLEPPPHMELINVELKATSMMIPNWVKSFTYELPID
jgi:hypothetical protein